MPAVLAVTVGVLGALAAARWIVRESRRINAELHPERYGGSGGTGPASHLRRDANGVYRPE